jgi:hypothetical protein
MTVSPVDVLVNVMRRAVRGGVRGSAVARGMKADTS